MPKQSSSLANKTQLIISLIIGTMLRWFCLRGSFLGVVTLECPPSIVALHSNPPHINSESTKLKTYRVLVIALTISTQSSPEIPNKNIYLNMLRARFCECHGLVIRGSFSVRNSRISLPSWMFVGSANIVKVSKSEDSEERLQNFVTFLI